MMENGQKWLPRLQEGLCLETWKGGMTSAGPAAGTWVLAQSLLGSGSPFHNAWGLGHSGKWPLGPPEAPDC